MRLAREDFSIEAAIHKGRQLPEWYINEPNIHPADYFYIRAFYDLSSCRNSGFELGEIPWTAKKKYTEHYGLDFDIAECFFVIIKEMDTAYINYKNKEIERNKPKNRSKNRGK